MAWLTPPRADRAPLPALDAQAGLATFKAKARVASRSRRRKSRSRSHPIAQEPEQDLVVAEQNVQPCRRSGSAAGLHGPARAAIGATAASMRVVYPIRRSSSGLAQRRQQTAAISGQRSRAAADGRTDDVGMQVDPARHDAETGPSIWGAPTAGPPRFRRHARRDPRFRPRGSAAGRTDSRPGFPEHGHAPPRRGARAQGLEDHLFARTDGRERGAQHDGEPSGAPGGAGRRQPGSAVGISTSPGPALREARPDDDRAGRRLFPEAAFEAAGKAPARSAGRDRPVRRR